MVFTKIKNIINPTNFIPDKYSINALVKNIIAVNYNNNIKQQALLHARLCYLSKYRYDRNISQAESIMLSNVLIHDLEKITFEVPHLIYHTLEQESRLQVIPDLDIFNIKDYKYGDYINIKTEKSIEVKTSKNFSQGHLDALKMQYNFNKRNDKFIFSCFYHNIINMTEAYAKNFLLNELQLEEKQVVIKSFASLEEHFTEANIEKAISYYNIVWAEYEIENRNRLKLYLKNLVQHANLDLYQKKKIRKFIILMEDKKNIKEKRKINYLPKNNKLLLEDKTVIDPIDIVELTPEAIMEDQVVINFNKEE